MYPASQNIFRRVRISVIDELGMEELWKPVVNYEGYYEVSNQGNVRRVGGHQLKAVLDNKYLEVNLCVKSKRKKFRVHQLVAFAFLSECPGEYGRGKGKYQIDHKNDNHLDNRAENLQWLLHGDNCFWKHAAVHIRLKHSKCAAA